MREELAEQLIHALQQDGRASYNELAARLDAPRNLVSTTVRRLLSTGQLRIVATAAHSAAGHHVLAHAAIRCTPHAHGVIGPLMAREDVPLVSAVTGAHDVVAELRAPDVASLHEVLRSIRAHPEVATTAVTLYHRVVKSAFSTHPSGDGTLDRTDIALFELLRSDGRMSFNDLAARIRLSPTAVRTRIRRMQEAGLLRVSALIPHTPQSGRVKVGVGLSLSGDDAEAVETIVAMPEVEFAAEALGRFDLIATLNSSDPAEIAGRLEDLRALPQVRHMETWMHVRTHKEDYSEPMAGRSVPPHPTDRTPQ
ncbi:Lrp/AsnC family transcriptional regulator [Nesterenkonia populi]|uniref:Lrp/AsnC family transcriptional regulator n=1 Tax=Nesterenkonia populi TaxID=1591087 RepID=UPI0011BDB61C|nr:Lrp/AsnC family transcriptional regulator [Nesterenkonia populi]